MCIRDRAADIEVNRNTVMRSYALMEQEGIIDNRRGIGFFVSDQARQRLATDEKAQFIRDELPKIVHQAKVLRLTLADFEPLIQQLHENQNQ